MLLVLHLFLVGFLFVAFSYFIYFSLPLTYSFFSFPNLLAVEGSFCAFCNIINLCIKLRQGIAVIINAENMAELKKCFSF